MTRYEYDEEESAALRMDVAHEAQGPRPAPVARWVDAMRLLNGIHDPLARKILTLHRDCGSGVGVCDSDGESDGPIARRAGWGCETTELVADHFGVNYPSPREPHDE